MSVPSSIFVILLFFTTHSCFSSPGAPINPNDIIRESINNAAGMELIPKQAKFKLTEFHGESTSDSINFPGGGSGFVSGSVYTGKLEETNGANNRQNGSFHFLTLIFFVIAILAFNN